MNYDEKKEFLSYAKSLARNLEGVTDEFVEVQIGWIEILGYDEKITIMVNDDESWFGTLGNGRWNEVAVWNSVSKFVPVDDCYLVLNELVNKAYNH